MKYHSDDKIIKIIRSPKYKYLIQKKMYLYFDSLLFHFLLFNYITPCIFNAKKYKSFSVLIIESKLCVEF